MWHNKGRDLGRNTQEKAKGRSSSVIRRPPSLVNTRQHRINRMMMMTNGVLLLPFLLALLLLPADALAVSGKFPSLTFYNNDQRS